MVFDGGGTVSGPVQGAAGTDIEFDGNSFNFTPSSSIISAREVGSFQGGEVITIGGVYDVTGGTYFRGSRVSFTAPITALGSDLNLFNAVVNLTGQPLSLATLEMTD